jgi:invasion protein IalB
VLPTVRALRTDLDDLAKISTLETYQPASAYTFENFESFTCACISSNRSAQHCTLSSMMADQQQQRRLVILYGSQTGNAQVTEHQQNTS